VVALIPEFKGRDKSCNKAWELPTVAVAKVLLGLALSNLDLREVADDNPLTII
jgi:hypothetical protein